MFKMTCAIALVASPLAATLAPVVAHAQIAPADQAAIDLALSRGQTLYAYDQAAWHGTDDMLARIRKPEKILGGYIVDGPAATPTLIFFDQNAADPHAVYVAQFRDNKLVSSRVLGDKDDRTLSPERKAMIAARAKGIAAWQAAKPLYCSRSQPNVAVLPPERPGGPYLVYVMTPQSDNGVWPFGGHFRVEVNADGSIGASRSFTRSCLDVPRAPKGAVGMLVTHLLDSVPTEIHVFTAIAARMPVVVATSDKRQWWVTGTAIELHPERNLKID